MPEKRIFFVKYNKHSFHFKTTNFSSDKCLVCPHMLIQKQNVTFSTRTRHLFSSQWRVQRNKGRNFTHLRSKSRLPSPLLEKHALKTWNKKGLKKTKNFKAKNLSQPHTLTWVSENALDTAENNLKYYIKTIFQ